MHRAAIFLLVAGLLAACGGGGTDGSAGGPGVAGEWEFAGGTADGADLPLPAGARATLVLEGGDMSGVAFCNRYFSTYRSGGSTFTADGIGSTEMGCEPDVMAAESAYLQALAGVETVTVGVDGLVLSGDGVELRFTPVAAVPDSDLTGTRWALETIVDSSTASSTVGPTAGLRLDPDGTVEASTGCRTVTGTWLLADDALVVDDLRSDGAQCPPDAERQDAHVQAVLQSRPALDLQEDRLTLTADDSRGLVYRAEA